MTTTAIIVEILIVGILSIPWIVLFAITAFGWQWLPNILTACKDWATAITILGVGIVYVIGIIMDRFADVASIFIQSKTLLLKSQWIKNKSKQAHSDIRMRIMHKEGLSSTFLEHIRSRIRIVRACVLNTPITCIALVVFMRTTSPGTTWQFCMVTISACIFLTIILFLCLGILEITYEKRMKQVADSERKEVIAEKTNSTIVNNNYQNTCQ